MFNVCALWRYKTGPVVVYNSVTQSTAQVLYSMKAPKITDISYNTLHDN